MTLPIGTRLGPYEIAALLGAGGMGEVYLARDTRLERDVAIKVLSDAGTGPDHQDRFLREARAASQLSHPNILTIHDISSWQGRSYIVMEYIEGPTLHHLLRERRLTLEQVLKYAIQICNGLAAAHSAGITHRDLKPGNVMIAPGDRVKVVDFGLAKRIAASAGQSNSTVPDALTIEGQVIGTPSYMSPEQALGDDVDPRSDVFSFGILLYEMLAGSVPFSGDSKSGVLRKIVAAEPRRLAELAPSTPVALQRLVEKCLQKDRDLRYGDCAKVKDDLQQIADALASPPPTVALPAARRRTLRPRVWIAASLLAAVIAAGLLYRFLPARAPATRGLAVLPFTPVGNDERTRAFSLGLVMAVSTNLSGLESFRNAFWVVPIGDVLQAKAQSPSEARQLFGVDLVIGGSVETSADRVRVNTWLTNARTQRQLRSRQLNKTASDALLLEDELVRAVGELLEIELPVEARGSVHSSGSPEPAAEDYYLQGRGYLQSGADKADFAVNVFRQALTRDPKFARAQAGLADAYLQKYFMTKDPQWIAQARAAGDEAIHLGGDIPEALIVLGAIEREQGRYEGAAFHLLHVIAIDPQNRDAWTRLAQARESQNKMQDAEDAFRKAIDLEPSYPGGYASLGSFYYRRGRYPEAERSFQRARELAPDNFRVYNQLGGLYLQTGRYGEAEIALKKSLELKPNALAYNNLSSCYFYQDRYAEAIPPMEQALQLGQVSVPLLANLARMYHRTPGLEAKAPPIYRQAFDLAQKQLQVNPRDAETHADVAWLRAESGDRQAARREIQLAQSLSPSNTAVLFRAILTYELIGERDQALRAWRSLKPTGSYLEEVRRRPELKDLRADPRFKEQ